MYFYLVLLIKSLPVSGITKTVQFNETISSANFQSFRKKWDHKVGNALNKTVKNITCLAYQVHPVYNPWLTYSSWEPEVSQGSWKVTAMSTFCFWRNTEECGSRALLSSHGTHHGHQPQLIQTQPSLLCLSLLILLAMFWIYLRSWCREGTRKNSNF